MKLKYQYKIKEKEIMKTLSKFKLLDGKEQYKELLFCLLTPQSQAKKCWQAVEKITKLPKKKFNKTNITNILKTHSRFHNNKTNYVLQAPITWKKIRPLLNNPDRLELRNNIAENIKGLGMKEASHFLRNIGKSENQIAILDRHILKNLEAQGTKLPKTITKANYLALESKFLRLAEKQKIPADHLDLLLWSQETSFIFK